MFAVFLCFISAIFLVAAPFYLTLNKYFIVNYFHSLIVSFTIYIFWCQGPAPAVDRFQRGGEEWGGGSEPDHCCWQEFCSLNN